MFVKYQHEPDKLLTFAIIPDWIVAWAIKVRDGRMLASLFYDEWHQLI